MVEFQDRALRHAVEPLRPSLSQSAHLHREPHNSTSNASSLSSCSSLLSSACASLTSLPLALLLLLLLLPQCCSSSMGKDKAATASTVSVSYCSIYSLHIWNDRSPSSQGPQTLSTNRPAVSGIFVLVLQALQVLLLLLCAVG